MSSTQLSASLLRLKLLEALSGGDNSKVESMIEELKTVRNTIQTTDIIQLKETVLHYAVQVAPLSTIQYLVGCAEKFELDINAQDVEGNTPLHLAALYSRSEVVKYLLSLPNINDTVVNLNKKQPVELCKDLAIAQLMQFERAKFVEKSATELRKYFSNRDFDNLERLLVANPRASELLDINGADPETGNTVLHEFIKKDDIQMCDWILNHRGDPFKRDKRGKLPVDLVSVRNEPLKKLIKAASKDQTIMDPIINTQNATKTGNSPTYKGYLKKWTNFASGYKLRYFILDSKGILSYYANQDDTNNACRGSLNLSFANLHLDSSEKLKFEILGKNGIRWHLKANHPIETNRWVWTLQNAITIARDNTKRERSKKDKVRGDSSDTLSNAYNSNNEESEPRRHRIHIPGRNKHKRASSQLSNASNTSTGNGVDENTSTPPSRSSTFSKHDFEASSLPTKITTNDSRVNTSRFSFEDQNSVGESDLENFDYDADEVEDNDSDSESTGKSESSTLTSLEDQISKIRRSLDVGILGVLDLLTKAGYSEFNSTEVHDVAIKSIETIKSLLVHYNDLIQLRNAKYKKNLDRQLEINQLWETSIRQLEDQIAEREKKLLEFEGKKKQLKKYLSSSGAKSDQTNTPTGSLRNPEIPFQQIESSLHNTVKERKGSSIQTEDDIVEQILNDESEDEFFDADEFEENEDSVREDEVSESLDNVSEQVTSGEEIVTPKSAEVDETKENKIEDDDDTAEAEGESEAKLTELQVTRKKLLEEEGSFLGYENPPRKKLSMDEDNRPKVGLWGILKSMIGKDMTRVTLPVSFNEPTSLLQRLAEDMEYVNLLNVAASCDDSTLRLVYVSAFASSEYASATNRIAKPFNPLLGETFEYCRPDQNYRLITEQVSHHPPVSACKAESVKWDYYGENFVDSKFRGRTFDFKHLGKMFAVVRPDNGVTNKDGQKVDEELYSWKKVDTQVVGIMLGNPTVDCYGQMKVENHVTGDYAIVDMKQRGWKASSAYQLTGIVYNKKGEPKWAIGGHWNTKVFARKISDKNQSSDTMRRQSLVDTDGETLSKSPSDPCSGQKFLVWQAAPRPKIPFNLTAFATTLNGLDDNLRNWIPPTDTRLRPDQRAMEEGRYDDAAKEKHRVEEKQRAAKRYREKNKITYKPNWFVKKKHAVTGDSYWEFNNKYWNMRSERKVADSGDIF